MATDLASVLLELGARLDGYRERIDHEISPRDEMFTGDLDDYLLVGHSAVAAVTAAMAVAGRTGLTSVLDLPCGHGRVLRALAAAFPEASLTACDVNREGVDFCSARFGARGIYSTAEPAQIPIEESFDLIFVGSLITHLEEARSRRFLDFFCDRLAPDGLLVFSTHGRNAMKRWRSLDDERLAAVSGDAHLHGYGYREHRPGAGYGTSGSKPSWVLDQFFDRRDVSVIGFTERGFADHQDMVAVMKLDVDHAQNARLNI